MINKPRVPLHWQNNEMSKSASKKSPSYRAGSPEHMPEYKDMGDRPSTHAMSRIRRYTNGQLDFDWAARAIMNAIHAAESNHPMTPVEESLLMVVFPLRFDKVEVAQAEVRTQLSRSEKAYLEELVEGMLKEELNWNAGYGGSVPGRTRTFTE